MASRPSRAPQQDNTTFDQKIMLRHTALNLLTEPPVVMETHGGLGHVYQAIYTNVEDGVVFEKMPDRTIILAEQRPTWAMYETDCVAALQQGAGSHLCVNLLDLDPYGGCWETMQAFFKSERPFAKRMILVVNDGMAHKIRGGGAWDTEILAPYVAKYGNHNMWSMYQQVAEEMTADIVREAGYEVTFWDGYRCGIEQKMLHFLAVLEINHHCGYNAASPSTPSIIQ